MKNQERRRNMAGKISNDDLEIKGYLNTKKEMIYKNIIWEIMNKDYVQGEGEKQKQKQKQPRKERNEKRKKGMVDEEEEEEARKMKKERLSMKVNLDVLEKQEEGGKEERKCEKIEENGKEAIDETESYGEENDYEEENDYGNLYYGNEEEEEEGYNFDEDCDFDEY